MKYETRLGSVCAALAAAKASYVLVGASAMQLWGSTRATRHVDILIEPTVANARRVLRALGTLGFGFAKELLAEEVASRPVTIVGDSPNVDILTIAWSVRYADAKHDAVTFEVEGVRIPTASVEQRHTLALTTSRCRRWYHTSADRSRSSSQARATCCSVVRR
jgi:hypothetical protein